MSRLAIDVTDQQHQALKAMAALEGKTIKQYVLDMCCLVNRHVKARRWTSSSS